VGALYTKVKEGSAGSDQEIMDLSEEGKSGCG